MSEKKGENSTVKILVVGNSGVGKTSLCNRYINDIFLKTHRPTVGVEFCSKEIVGTKCGSNKESANFNLQFWDIGGQERYIYMTHVYYKNSDFCLIMFDLNNLESFKACARWKRDLDDKYRLEDGSKCPCLLIGNKCDLSTRILEQSDIEDFCRDYEFYGYMEISVKKNIMVKETIEYITGIIVVRKELEQKASLTNGLSKKYDSISDANNNNHGSNNNSSKKQEASQQQTLSLKCNSIFHKLKADGKKVGCLSDITKKPTCCQTA